jgi:protein gp37
MSKIEWTETTWNPTTVCDRISPACDNCYALIPAKRLEAMGSPLADPRRHLADRYTLQFSQAAESRVGSACDGASSRRPRPESAVAALAAG